MKNEVILLAGGLGTRLQKAVPDLPKPMALVCGRPFVEYIMDYLIEQNVNKFIFSVGYRHEVFKNHFSNNYKGCEVVYSVEDTPLGTGGGIKRALEYAEFNDVLIVNADTLFKVDISSFYSMHRKEKVEVSLALKNMEDVQRYGSVEITSGNRITGFSEKKNKPGQGMINGGVYLLNKKIFIKHVFAEKFSFEKDYLEQYYYKIKFCGYPSNGYFLDIGIPEDYEKAQSEFKRI